MTDPNVAHQAVEQKNELIESKRSRRGVLEEQSAKDTGWLGPDCCQGGEGVGLLPRLVAMMGRFRMTTWS